MSSSTIKVNIYHYHHFLKGASASQNFNPSTTLGEICNNWKTYYKTVGDTGELEVWKFKNGDWSTPVDVNNPYFDKNTTLQQYIDYYSGFGDVFIIFI